MTAISENIYDPSFDSFEVKAEDYVIGGKMVTGEFLASAEMFVKIRSNLEFSELVKYELAVRLAKVMIEKQLLEYTMEEDYVNQAKKIRVRGYLAPNDQVKILRLHRSGKL